MLKVYESLQERLPGATNLEILVSHWDGHMVRCIIDGRACGIYVSNDCFDDSDIIDRIVEELPKSPMLLTMKTKKAILKR